MISRGVFYRVLLVAGLGYLCILSVNNSFKEPNCAEKLLKHYNTSRMLLWDGYLVRVIEEGGSCKDGDLLNFESFAILSPPKKSLLTFKDNEKHNFYQIQDGQVSRGLYKKIWREYGRVLVPENVRDFEEHWRRSRLLTCRNMTFERDKKKNHGWSDQGALKAMEELNFHFLKHGMHLFLMDGTLLGWYRECQHIPYTTDVDFAFMWTEHRPLPFELIVQKSTSFKPLHRTGFHGRDLEWAYTSPGIKGSTRIDLFEVNDDGNTTYTTAYTGKQVIKYTHPQRYDPFCAANFKGYLFWITCSPEIQLTASYGNWTEQMYHGVFDYRYSQPNMKNVYKYNDTVAGWKETNFG